MKPRHAPLPRTAALVALGALIVHQLRYAAAYGGDAGTALAAQGHGYLSQVMPILVAVALASVAGCLVRSALRGPVGEPRGRLASAGIFCLAILATFAVQEAVEGVLFGAHLGGFGAVFGAGGWIAVPLAVAFGAVCAVIEAGLNRLEWVLSEAVGPARRRRRTARSVRAPRTIFLRRISPLALGLASRPPPARA
jgi:hypothetical protein